MELQLLTEGVYIDQTSVVIREANDVFIYCRQCNGLKLLHLINAEHPKQQRDMAVLWPPCVCHVSRSLTTDQVIMGLLNDLLRTIKTTISTTKSMEDAGERADKLIWRLASQQEMR